MSFLYLFVSIVFMFFGFWYFYACHKLSYWTKRGVKGPKAWPVFGHTLEQYQKGQHGIELDWAQKYGQVYGTFDESGLPALNISDPELIKQVMIKDFHLFINRTKVDEESRKMLFFAENQDWKRVRAITSPAFTSGKLRSMNELMIQCVDKLCGYFDRIAAKSEEANFNAKKVTYGFTIDVIASTFFGTETNANGDRDKDHPLVLSGMRIFESPTSLTQILISKLLSPKLLHIFSYIFGPKSDIGGKYIREMLTSIAAVRQENNTGKKRNDFVQLLIDARVNEHDLNTSDYHHLTASFDHEGQTKTTKNISINQQLQAKEVKQLTDAEILAQMKIFFVAGFETTATTISHCLFELAANEKIQEKLYNQIHHALHRVDPKSDLFCEVVMTKIVYLDAIIKETLRKYPPLTRVERRVGQDQYQLAGVTLTKDQMVYISVYAVHHNAEYYPEPDRFNPDRFMPENKHCLVPYTYLPFGQGPRNCIGMRFAYQEIKLCLVKIIQQFKFSLPEGAPRKLSFQKFNVASAMPFQLSVVKR